MRLLDVARAILALLALTAAGPAPTPLQAARGLLERYDQDLGRIERARDLLEGALARGAADVPLCSR